MEKLNMALGDIISTKPKKATKKTGGAAKNTRGRGRGRGRQNRRGGGAMRTNRRNRQRTAPYNGRQGGRNANGNAEGEWVHDKFTSNGGDDVEAPQRNNGGIFGLAGGSRAGVRKTGLFTGTRLMISNLHHDVLEEDIQELFGRIG